MKVNVYDIINERKKGDCAVHLSVAANLPSQTKPPYMIST